MSSTWSRYFDAQASALVPRIPQLPVAAMAAILQEPQQDVPVAAEPDMLLIGFLFVYY
jgi:hypothetical protein